MSARLGWALAVVLVALGYVLSDWRGALLAVSGIVIWLLLRFSLRLHAVRSAAGAPVGSVPSALMLNAKLRPGLRLSELIPLTRSRGEKLAENPETYRWTDDAGVSVSVELVDGRCVRWTLARPASETVDPA